MPRIKSDWSASRWAIDPDIVAIREAAREWRRKNGPHEFGGWAWVEDDRGRPVKVARMFKLPVQRYELDIPDTEASTNPKDIIDELNRDMQGKLDL